MFLSRVRSIGVSALLLTSAVASTGVADPPETLHIRADSWMPFNGDPTAEKPGYVVELLRQIFEPQGFKIDYQIMPWAGAVKAAEAAEIDGIIGANRKEAVHLVAGEEAIAEPRFALFARSTSLWKYESLRSLHEVKLGAIEGYSYWDSLDGYLKKSQPPAVKLYSGDTPLVEAIADLSSGKIDVLVESVVVFYWAARSTGRGAADFRMAYSQQSEPLYVAFAATTRGRKYARLFDEGIRDLKKNARFQAILGKYGLNN
jgi:polar amino acid transport system substrate-binding protein